jgi:tRNA(Ile2) C34 agmatinyltransferase TiaS
MEGWKPNPDPLCQKCGEQPAGPGGIICPDCKVAIETANVELIARPAGEG